MAYEVPALGTAGQVYTAAAHNIIVNDVLNFRSIQNRFAMARRSSTDIVMNSTNWANLDTGLDLTLNAAAGDVIEVACSGLARTEDVDTSLDVVTVVSGSPVSSFGSAAAVVVATTFGVQAWRMLPAATFNTISGSAFYTLLAGDVSGGTVLLRLRYRTYLETNKTMVAESTTHFVVSAKNLGPVTT